MGDPCVFFIKFPTEQKFCHVVLKIENQKITPQNQTLKCRQLLFLCREVIASPNMFDGALIDAVLNVTFFKEKKLLPYCQKLGLKIIHASAAMLGIIQECLSYTFQFKISSHWNKIGQFLVKGPDVVICSGRQDAVDVDVTVSHEQVTLTVRPHAIRNPPPTLEDFSICFQALQNFKHLNQDIIEEFSIYQSWCHVMPSMKKGQLSKVSRTIPIQNCNEDFTAPIKDYGSLKKYWKNHHGIKLPDTEDGMLYGSVYFKLIGPQLFTYPLCCLRTKDIQILPRCDGPAIIKNFMGVLNQKMDRVCGFKLMFSSKPCYVNSNLSEVSQIVPENFHNVSTQPQNKAPPPPKPPVVSIVANISESQRDDVIFPSQNKPSKGSKAELEVIPSSQVSQNEKHAASWRAALGRLQTTADGKYIPSFGGNKKDISVKNTSNCGRKIDTNLPKTKPRNGVMASATMCKKYKTPRQNRVDMNDSGYSADETPITSSSASNRAKAEKKLQPKKLCFDQVLDPACKKTLNPSILKKIQSKIRSAMPGSNTLTQHIEVLPVGLQGRPLDRSDLLKNGSHLSPSKVLQNHSFDSLFAKAGDSNHKGAGSATGGNKFNTLSKTEVCKKSDQIIRPGLKSADSPLKVLKNHKFDQLFSKAGKHPDKEVSSQNRRDIPILKSHKFDQLFSKAGQQNAKDSTANCNEHSHLKISKKHEFDQIFSKAGQRQVKGDTMHCDKGSPLKIPKNHRFNQLFSKAGDACQFSTDKSSISGDSDGSVPLQRVAKDSRNHNDSGIGLFEFSPGKTLANHCFDDIFKTANSDLKEESRVFSSIDGNTSNFSNDCRYFSSDKNIAKTSIAGIPPINNSLFEGRILPNSSFFTSDFRSNCENAANVDQTSIFPVATRISTTNPSSGDGSRLIPGNSFEKIKLKITEEIDDRPSTCVSQNRGDVFNKAAASCDDRPKQKYNLHTVLERVSSDFSEGISGNVQQGQTISSGTTSRCQKQKAGKPTKRRLGVGSATFTEKRAKLPQNLDVVAMAKAGMLNKVTVPTLTSWLNSNGVATTSRWKKQELIAKVKFQVMLTENGFRGCND